MKIKFTKMHGLGNDFIVIDNMDGKISLSEEQIVFICDRHKGVGADGVILVEPSDVSDCFMNYYNSDGTIAEMCGNGIRCTAKFLNDEILKSTTTTDFKIDTRAGIKEIEYISDGTFSVNMGKPVFQHEDFPSEPVELENLSLNFASMGNPHAVAFVEDLTQYDLATLGPKIENNKNFPNKINLELVEKISPSELKIKVWERGCGITLACGTGACAVYTLARKYENVEKEMIIHLPGGDLYFFEDKEGNIIMRGAINSVFSSTIEV